MPLIGMLFGSRIGIIITVVVLGSGAFFTWLAIHDHNVKNAATEEYNRQQAEIVQKKQEEFNQQTNQINDNAARIREILKKQEEIAAQGAVNIEQKAAADSKSAGTDQSSKYLKSIIQQLDSNYGMKK
jgi:uncharacterized membrane protein YhiD involved in acid resistance